MTQLCLFVTSNPEALPCAAQVPIIDTLLVWMQQRVPASGRPAGGARSVLPRTGGSSARYSELSERKQPFSHQMLVLLMRPLAPSFSLSPLSLSLHPPPNSVSPFSLLFQSHCEMGISIKSSYIADIRRLPTSCHSFSSVWPLPISPFGCNESSSPSAVSAGIQWLGGCHVESASSVSK